MAVSDSAMAQPRDVLKKLTSRFGYEIRRAPKPGDEYCRLKATLDHLCVSLVLDVGANSGQFGHGIRQAGYGGRIVSFEPLAEAHTALAARARGDASWTVHARCAVGASIGDVEINVAANSVSSSVLPISRELVELAPDTRRVGAERVKLITVDSIFDTYRREGDVVMLKVDTQGYEQQVLEGAVRSLEHTRAALVELSLVAIYDGQPLWDVFLDRFRRLGFVVWAIEPAFADHRTGRTVQVDVLFVRG